MKQHDSIHFLDSIKKRYQLPSDYAVHKLLGVSRENISSIRNRRSTFGPETAIKVADLLGLPRGYVVACCEVERAKSDDLKAVWADMAKSALGCILLALSSAVSVGPGTANAAGTGTGQNAHYAKRRYRESSADWPMTVTA